MKRPTAPLVVEFVSGSKIRRQEAGESPLPVYQNGLPGTYVSFANGKQVALPTDQIVLDEEHQGGARVGFGGMTFEGVHEGHLVFWRVRDLLPEELLSPERGLRMTLDPKTVRKIVVNGQEVWSRP